MPASDGVARWSADSGSELGRELRAAGRRELVGVEPQRQPVTRRPPARIRRDWSASNTPLSQKTSQNRARPWAATPGSCSSMIDRT